MVVGTIRLDRVVRKDFAPDDHLPLSDPREVLLPRRVVQARQQPKGELITAAGMPTDRSSTA